MSDWRKRHDRFMAALDRGDFGAAEAAQDAEIAELQSRHDSRMDSRIRELMSKPVRTAGESLLLEDILSLQDECMTSDEQ